MAYQTVDDLKELIDYEGSDFYDHNEDKQFDDLLTRLEKISRSAIENRVGDETFAEETGRVDTFRATDDASIPLVYPVNDVTKVEGKTTLSDDWTVIDADRYDFTDHRLILAKWTGRATLVASARNNPLTQYSNRQTWRDLYTKLRVTYDRGFSTIPHNIQQIQADIVTRLLRKLRREQSVAGLEPDQIAAMDSASAVLTDDLKDRIDSITGLGGKTQSV